MKNITVYLLLFGVAASGSSMIHAADSDSAEEMESSSTEISAEMAEQSGIQSATAGAGTIARTITSYGRLVANPDGISHIRARFPGPITDIEVSPGDQVDAGDAMATIESNDSLQSYILRAPIAGTVIQRDANVGELADGQTLFSVASLDTLWAELRIFPGQRSEVAVGQAVRLDAGGVQQDSTIAAIVPRDLDSPYVLARVEVDNESGLLSPGRLVSASIEVQRIEAPLVIENRALQTLGEGSVVFLQDGNVFEAQPVELGRTDGIVTEVLAGLESGDRYVVENSYLVKADLLKSTVSDDD